MKRAERMKIADAAAKVASISGAIIQTNPAGVDGKQRYTTVEVNWPEVSASFDIGGVNAPGVLISFYGAKRDLRHARVFDSINTFHKRKATTWCDTIERFESYWPIICKAIASGEVFA